MDRLEVVGAAATEDASASARWTSSKRLRGRRASSFDLPSFTPRPRALLVSRSLKHRCRLSDSTLLLRIIHTPSSSPSLPLALVEGLAAPTPILTSAAPSYFLLTSVIDLLLFQESTDPPPLTSHPPVLRSSTRAQGWRPFRPRPSSLLSARSMTFTST